MEIAVVVVGYNRPHEMKRLLFSLCRAKYHQPCDLIISLDFGKIQKDLIEIGENIEWENGKKEIRAFKTNQGLRNHILQCGDYTEKYDAVIVLEDDLVVAENFFQYVIEAVEFYENDTNIAGISLYTHRTNPGNGRPFEAQFGGYDAFFMQYAQSWGQCWTRRMWNCFRNWYNSQSSIANDGLIPDYIVGWDDRSWLKYYIRYTVEKGLYYVYPYFSLTTNGSACGEHNTEVTTAYQVPLSCGNITDYRFPREEQAVKYDAYFERIFDKELVDIYHEKVCIDFYGLRRTFGDAKILISIQRLDFLVKDKLKLSYRPHELNAILGEEGNDIYVYDLRVKTANKEKKNSLAIVKYDLKAISARETFMHCCYGIAARIKRIFFKRLTL